jgi:anti-sigma B factor antagonist
MDQNATFEVDVREDTAQCHVRLRGELDVDTASRVKEALEQAEQTRSPWIVVDMTELAFIDSTGIQALLMADRNARRNGHRLSFTRGGPQVERVLRLCGLGSTLDFLDP